MWVKESQTFEPSPATFQGAHYQEAGIKSWTRVHLLQNEMQASQAVLTAVPNAH